MVPRLYAYILAQTDPYRRIPTGGALVPILITNLGLLMGYAFIWLKQVTAAGKAKKGLSKYGESSCEPELDAKMTYFAGSNGNT
ncbi:hypothetical protein BDB00DRAFT_869290 [Zychaea mexicana]|uniref:uncharacterized protein n=1 Tax=Zychaea mexicana TaxID=64656 RepID=UPI0022FEF7A5|nr:uncharacterized protein BDB00DRAFT_869290 [Zychaea mexicana]KAI9496711.1 hypothetical protein BDB00DRAFT_869290 [Zychaea mexicana]